MAMIRPTKGELFQAWRIRLGLRQPQMAKRLGTDIGTYRAWEMGDRLDGGPPVPVVTLETHEVCRVLRKRAKKTQRQVAEDMGVSTLWVLKMEQGTASVDQLAKFWGIG